MATLPLIDAAGVNALAVVTGADSDLIVLDVDLPSLQWWSTLLQSKLPLRCPSVSTCSGGVHYYFIIIKSVANGLVKFTNQQ